MHSFISKVIVISAYVIEAIAVAASLRASDSTEIIADRAWQL